MTAAVFEKRWRSAIMCHRCYIARACQRSICNCYCTFIIAVAGTSACRGYITSSICHRQLCRYCFYSGPIIAFFAPQGRHVAPIKVKFGRKERTAKFVLLPAKFDLDRFRGGGLRPQKLEKNRIFTI